MSTDDDPLCIWVVDASALIEIKQRVAVDEQWAMFEQLSSLVAAGQISLVRQVIKEVGEGRWPDAPGAWASGMRNRLRHPLDAPLALVRDVLQVAPKIIEENATDEVADPYVLAMALHLQESGHDVTVVTEDDVDRLPLKMSMATAAKRLEIDCYGLEAFLLDTVGITCRKRRQRPA